MEAQLTRLEKKVLKLTKRVAALEAQLGESPVQKSKSSPSTGANNTSSYQNSKTITITEKSGKNPSVLITGQTYDYRTLIKDKGGKWEKDQKGWKIPSQDLNLTELTEQLSANGVKVIHVGTKGKPKSDPVALTITKSNNKPRSKSKSPDKTPATGPSQLDQEVVECTILSDTESDSD